MTLHIIYCSHDLPAKALGFWGGGICEQSGRSVRTDSGGTVLAFLYDNNQPKDQKTTEVHRRNQRLFFSGTTFCSFPYFSMEYVHLTYPH